jgi:Cu+-exporting ATPase
MTVDPAAARASTVYQGNTYYFCCPYCLQRFQAAPEHFLAPAPPAAPTPAATPPGTKTQYFCPMDPEVISDRPGSCPKCGMALQPRTLSLEEGPDPELADMSRRFWIGLALTIPL